jgi:hypothetical protein
MFRWLGDGEAHLSVTATDLFETVFKAGLISPLSGSFHLELSEAPKQEAAYGLVCRTALTKDADYSSEVIAGESFVRDGVESGWDTVIDSGFFEKQVRPPAHLDRLTDFISIYNRFAGKNTAFLAPIPWDDRAAEDIRADVAKSLNDIATNGVVDVEPVYVIALRSLLQKNSKP